MGMNRLAANFHGIPQVYIELSIYIELCLKCITGCHKISGHVIFQVGSTNLFVLSSFLVRLHYVISRSPVIIVIAPPPSQSSHNRHLDHRTTVIASKSSQSSHDSHDTTIIPVIALQSCT